MKKQSLLLIVIFCGICNLNYAQILVHPTGNITVGPGTRNSATLNVSGETQSTIFSVINHTKDYGDAIKSQVSRPLSISYVTYYNGTKTQITYGNGSVWSSSFITFSDSILKSNIQPMNSITDRFMKLQPVEYDKNPTLRMRDKYKTFGLIAQDVEKVFPEVVYQDENELKAISYVELIPVLIEVLKEKSSLIDNLNERLIYLESKLLVEESLSSSSSSSNEKTYSSNLDISQNPSVTKIKYNVPTNLSNISIHVYNYTGNLINKYELNNSDGSVELPTNSLGTGIYLFTLVGDNKIIDTKKILINK